MVIKYDKTTRRGVSKTFTQYCSVHLYMLQCNIYLILTAGALTQQRLAALVNVHSTIWKIGHEQCQQLWFLAGLVWLFLLFNQLQCLVFAFRKYSHWQWEWKKSNNTVLQCFCGLKTWNEWLYLCWLAEIQIRVVMEKTYWGQLLVPPNLLSYWK